jgi:hypothetical protein
MDTYLIFCKKNPCCHILSHFGKQMAKASAFKTFIWTQNLTTTIDFNTIVIAFKFAPLFLI